LLKGIYAYRQNHPLPDFITENENIRGHLDKLKKGCYDRIEKWEKQLPPTVSNYTVPSEKKCLSKDESILFMLFSDWEDQKKRLLLTQKTAAILLDALSSQQTDSFQESVVAADAFLDDLTLHLCRYLDSEKPENKKDFLQNRLKTIRSVRDKHPRLSTINSLDSTTIEQCFYTHLAQ
jgi:hypothetical protein